MHRFSDHSEDLDTFEHQQELFQPCQLRYAKNAIDLLNDELSFAHELIARYQRDGLKLLAQHDEMRAEVKRLRGELMAWTQYKITCHTSGTALANRFLPVLPEHQAQRNFEAIVGSMADAKREIDSLRKALYSKDMEIQALKSQILYLSSSTSVRHSMNSSSSSNPS
ncbi:hypothetical protein [uncultured Pseudomonas sp.]|uniref:hypothetical protein n=1 Tax=uncultured Pseudomonas sp. TaxID=114707 RepID=UPI0025EA4167|nr:hypothetical protein [uncultured Pseudomonas sp.]